MSYETFYPEQRQMLNSVIIRRARMLPDDAYETRVDVAIGARVGLKDVVARGYSPAPFTLVDGAAFFGLRRPSDLALYMVVGEGDYVDRGELVAQKQRRRLLSPAAARVVTVDGGLIVLQQASGVLELEAGLNGQIVEVRRDRGVVIETIGALLQGVWGNGKRVVSTLRFEPPGGLEAVQSDELDFDYRGAILITTQTLTAGGLAAMRDQGFAGLIAPSLEPRQLDQALAAPGPVLLTEGFGSMRMSPPVAQFLETVAGRQGTLEAADPGDLSARPEVIINVPLSSERPSAPLTNLSLQMGMLVRVARADGASVFGNVIAVPRDPMTLENGLRTECAQIELVTGERIFVPLENLEIPGR
jgi:hypothetical protein